MFPEDFLRLLCNATAIVGNSSVAIRECSFLGVPAVNIGSRQQGRERGRNVIDVDHDRQRDRRRDRRALDAAASRRRDRLYGDGKAGARIADTLATAELTRREAADVLMMDVTVDCGEPRGADRGARLRLRGAADGAGRVVQPVRGSRRSSC